MHWNLIVAFRQREQAIHDRCLSQRCFRTFSRCLTLDDRTSIAATFCPVECAQLHCDPCSWSLCHASPVGNESPRGDESEGNTMTPAAPRGCGWATKMRTKTRVWNITGRQGHEGVWGCAKGAGVSSRSLAGVGGVICCGEAVEVAPQGPGVGLQHMLRTAAQQYVSGARGLVAKPEDLRCGETTT
jgi:hypothetical protein